MENSNFSFNQELQSIENKTVSLHEYRCSQTAKIGCNDCKGCNQCCENMGNSIVLDPYDMWMLTSNLRLVGNTPVTYEILTCEDGPLELSNHDGLILPNIKMVVDDRPGHSHFDTGICPFLNVDGRCTIHSIRTGLCRLYPLGRNFYPDKITYFVLTEELGCPSKKKSYVKISDWLEIPDIEKYEAFQLKWHNLKKEVLVKMQELNHSMEEQKTFLLHFLKTFYQTPYSSKLYQEFYQEFEQRLLEFTKQFFS